MSPMSTPPGDDGRLMSIDELAAATGLTVRTTRYYAGLGLLPPPRRRGRVALYDEGHRARLDLVRALQEHGFTLAAIERYVARIPADADVDELVLQRAVLASWTAGGYEQVDRPELVRRAGRDLTDQDLKKLAAVAAIREVAGGRFELLPGFEVGVECLDLDIPVDSLVEAREAIGRHMDGLVEDLTRILREKVLAPYREASHGPAEAAAFERTMTRLRRLTLEAVVSGFQGAANQVIARSLER